MHPLWKTRIVSLGMVTSRLDSRLHFSCQHHVRLRSLVKASWLVKGGLKSQWWWALGISRWSVTWNIANTFSHSSWSLLSIGGVYVFSRSVVQSCPALCNPMGCSPLGSSVHGILQARILEWVAISTSSGSSRPRDWTRVSYIGRQTLYLLSHQWSPTGGYHAVCWMNEYIPCPMSVLCLNQTVRGVVAGNLQRQEPLVTLLRCPCHLRGPQTGSHVPHWV